MSYEIKHIIHSQKRRARNHHETILMDAIEHGIDNILNTRDLPLSETVTVRLLTDGQLERVLCVTNDERLFALLNDPKHKEAKDSLYRRFFENQNVISRFSNLMDSKDEYPMKNEFIKFGYRTIILVKINHMGVVAVHSEIDITDPDNLRVVKAQIHKFRKAVLRKIKQTWEGKLYGLYQEIGILTSLAQRDEEKAFHQILEFMSGHHPIFRCAIFVVHPESESYLLLAGYPKGAHGTGRGCLVEHPLLRYIVEHRKSVHITDLAGDPRTKWLTRPGGVVARYGVTEIAGFPIIHNQEIKAVMTVDYAGKDFCFNPLIDLSFFQSVSDIISNILSIVSKIKGVRLDEDICRIVDHFLHEIRNPLTASAGFARRNFNQFQKVKLDKEKLQGALDGLQRNTGIIVRESDRIEEILNEFETFVRLKHGEIKITKASVPLMKLGKYFVDVFRGLKLSVSPDLEEDEFFIDRSRLHQVLFNLLKNAYEHSYEMDYKSLMLQSRSFFAKDIFLKILQVNENIVFEIINEGSISENIQGRIFEPYFTCGFHDGCGLGLPISAELVKLMNGQIEYENMVMEGKKYVFFRLTFSNI